jgi:hypothetical protein
MQNPVDPEMTPESEAEPESDPQPKDPDAGREQSFTEARP